MVGWMGQDGGLVFVLAYMQHSKHKPSFNQARRRVGSPELDFATKFSAHHAQGILFYPCALAIGARVVNSLVTRT